MAEAERGLTFVVMADLHGSGITTLVVEIEKRLGWTVIDKDTFKATLLEPGLVASLVYELAFALVTNILLRQQLSVIVDTRLACRSTLGFAKRLSKSSDACLKVVFCQCTEEFGDRRMYLSHSRRSQAQGLKSTVGNPAVCYDYLPDDVLVLHTSQPSKELEEQVLAYI